jgi:hypothetical protein
MNSELKVKKSLNLRSEDVQQLSIERNASSSKNKIYQISGRDSKQKISRPKNSGA